MASDGDPVKIPATSLVHGSQAPTTVVLKTAGNTLPPSSNTAGTPPADRTAIAAKAAAAAQVQSAAQAKNAAQARSTAQAKNAAPQSLVTVLNKYLNDSGRPDQFRVDPASEGNIQEVNPATGEVIAEYSASEFPALARSVGATSGLVDSHA